MEFTVKNSTPLLEFLLVALHGKSRTAVKGMLARRIVSVDGEIVTHVKHPLSAGQIVTIGDKSPEKPKALRGVKIIFEDDAVIVIDKSAGLLSVAADTGTERSAQSVVSEYITRRNPKQKVFVVHRLDRDTSGIMMFVKDKEMQRNFRTNWQEVVLTRTYAVVVEGVVAKNGGTIKSWLHGTDGLRTWSDQNPEGGQKAISHYKVIQRSAEFSLLDVELETGRKNQIRVHMQDLGHPVVGDEKYGARTNPIGRLGLHARVLAFVHPVTGEQLTFESDVPGEFLRLFRN